MNDICEIWNLPWHALQKSLANGLMADFSIPAIGSVYVQSAAVGALTWLGRARLRANLAARAATAMERR
jgi:hypothetical protein